MSSLQDEIKEAERLVKLHTRQLANLKKKVKPPLKKTAKEYKELKTSLKALTKKYDVNPEMVIELVNSELGVIKDASQKEEPPLSSSVN